MRKRFVIGLVAAVLAIGIVFAKRHELLRFTFQTAVSVASGYKFNYADQRIGPDHAALIDLHVTHNGYPVLDARRLDVWYSLRDLLPGSTHRFGLTAVAVDGAKLTIVHFRDGTYNFDVPQGSAPSGPELPVPVNPVPIRFGLRMENARMELLEPYAFDASAKDVTIHDFNVHADIDSSKLTSYSALGAFLEGKTNLPFTINGKIDAVRGYAMHRAQAARFPLRSLANYFSDTPVLRILAGRARNFDARLYSLDVEPNAPSTYHVNLQLDLDGAKMAFQAINAPIENIRGHLELIDNDVFVRGMTADLAGVPMRMTGGLYDLSGDLTGIPQLRLGVEGAGELAKLRTAFNVTRDQEIRGHMTLGVLVEGPMNNPMIVAHGHANHAMFRAMPLSQVDVSVLYRDGKIGVLPLLAQYSGTNVAVRGTLDISGKQLISDIALHADVTAQHLPYMDEMLADEPLAFDAIATGKDLVFHVTGAFASTRGVDRVAGLVNLEPNGTARIVPMWIHSDRGDFDGGYVLDRPNGTSAFWGIGSNLTLHAPKEKTFVGIDLPVIPKIEGHVANFTAAGGGAGKTVEIAGTFDGRAMSFADVPFYSIHAAFGGTMNGAAVNEIRASGPWGEFTGGGGFSTTAFVARGQYRGTLDGLQTYLGKDIPGHGPVAGTAAIEVVGNRIIVQGENLQMPGATLRGIPVSNASLTLAIDGDSLDIYSAHAHAAGGDVVAAGHYNTSSRPSFSRALHPLSIVANGLDAAQLHGIGLPIDSGRLTASGNLSAGAPLPFYRGGVSIANGHMQQYPISGNAEIDLAGNGVALARTIGALGTTYAYVDGRIDSLASGSPTYGLDATIPAGNVAGTLHTLSYPNYMTEGSFNARLRVGGSGAYPRVSGTVGVPGGNVNGLPFIDATGSLAASASGVSLHHGRVQVGKTNLHFTAVVLPHENAFHVASDRADLSDFNNFFDTGDTLDGNGTLRLGAFLQRGHINTSGNIDIQKFRYRNLPIGDTRAVWSSRRNEVTGNVAIGGAEGALQLNGTIGLAPTTDMGALVSRSRYDLTGSIANLDLSLWVPALGFQSVPITGRASGNATLIGRYPALAMHGDARIDGGTIGPLTLDTATVAVHANGTRVAIDSSQLVTPGLNASATGSFGLRPSDKLDLQVHAATDDMPGLVYQLSRVRVPVTGSFESTLQIAGTMHSPSFSAGFDATDVQAYGISIASAFGEVKLRGTTLVLSDAGANLSHGEATLAGSLPLELSPLRIGPSGQPISFDLDVLNVDPSFLNGILGSNTKLGGAVNGHLGISGHVGAPEIRGHASLEGGTYVSDLERSPILGATATLTFNRTSASITKLFARVGNGTVYGNGSLNFPDGFSASDLAFDVTGHAKNAQLDIPAYGKGTLDADVNFKKAPAKIALFSGTVALSNATLPFSAFIAAAKSGSTKAGPPYPLAFDLQASAGKNVRVRGSGYGAGLDIGAGGSVKLTGTLAAPTLAGAFTSSGGTLTYFDRAFRVQKGAVTFDPGDGVLPVISAVAVANVSNPDPDRARNPYGSADITISVNGPIEGLKIGLTSSPPGYTQDQIIALIAPFGGFFASNAFNTTNPYQVQTPGGFTPLGAVNPLPGVYVQRGNALTVGEEAFNILNAQFATGILGSVENALGQGLGLSSVSLNLGYYGTVGVKARRELSKTLSAVYGVTFGIPQVQSFGLQYSPNVNTSATVSVFTQSGSARLFQTSNGYFNNGSQFVLGQPLQGNNGFSFALTRNL